MEDQVRSRRAGWLARARQKLLTKSERRVERMSSKTACTRGSPATSSSVQSFTVAIRVFPDHGARRWGGLAAFIFILADRSNPNQGAGVGKTILKGSCFG